MTPPGTAAPAAAASAFSAPVNAPAPLGGLVGNLPRRRRAAKAFRVVCLVVTLSAVALLLVLLADIARQGLPWVDRGFFESFPSRFPEKAGIKSALAGTIWLIAFTTLISVPVGIGAAVYLEEYAPDNWIARFIAINILNLAGVPSIVYGMLGLALFVRAFGLGRSVIAGALTMSLLILPVIIIASREAIRAVPRSLRLASFALGVSRWETVRSHVLPAALPGIMTGVILAISRAIGETAPLVMMGALTFVAFVPTGPLDEFSALPIQIFNWASRPQREFHELAAAGIIVLLVVLLLMNTAAIVIRNRSQKNRPQ